MQRVLILEDEHLIALMLAEWLAEVDCEVVGIAKSIKEALCFLARSTPDAAILDLQVADGPAYPVARELRKRRIPFVFATGHMHAEIDPDFALPPIASKPFDFERLTLLLRNMPCVERNAPPHLIDPICPV